MEMIYTEWNFLLVAKKRYLVSSSKIELCIVGSLFPTEYFRPTFLPSHFIPDFSKSGTTVTSLTGLCSEGIDLLQRYVDLTGDVQTVALVTIHTLQHAIAKDSRLAHWVQR